MLMGIVITQEQPLPIRSDAPFIVLLPFRVKFNQQDLSLWGKETSSQCGYSYFWMKYKTYFSLGERR